MIQGMKAQLRAGSTVAAAFVLAMPALAGAQAAAEPPAPAPRIIAQPIAEGTDPAATQPVAEPGTETSLPPAPVIEELPLPWTVADAQALLGVIEGIGEEGLIPEDYRPDGLRAAIAAGPGAALDEVAARSFTWLVEDLRDGRTPMADRVQWFAVDPDQDVNPTAALMRKALESGDVPGVLASLAPTHAHYAALKAELAATPRSATARRALVRANMDRWRWLPRDLGQIYLFSNVPEFQLRLMSGERMIRSYRTIVGKPGRTATPQLAEQVKNIVFNPTWTVPQSIVKGEGMGARLLANPASARRQGYAVTKGSDGVVYVVQQPGPNNALGLVKIDMPNPHAIYLHDTPNRGLFNAQVRAFSHGCVRTEDAMRLAITMAILGAGVTPEQAVEYSQSGKYTKVPMTRTFPVYLGYFTMGPNVDGVMSTFADLYGRDAPVLASFDRARELHSGQRKSNEEVIQLDNPL